MAAIECLNALQVLSFVTNQPLIVIIDRPRHKTVRLADRIARCVASLESQGVEKLQYLTNLIDKLNMLKRLNYP